MRSASSDSAMSAQRTWPATLSSSPSPWPERLDSPWLGHRLPWWHFWSAQLSAVVLGLQLPPPVGVSGSSHPPCPEPYLLLSQRSPRPGSLLALYFHPAAVSH